ncbi:hypothetical protein IFM47457_00745 [Aspergillus lentulus]|nr:hypothetical protein IFM47457_00745 [Aspergillus lentulus]
MMAPIISATAFVLTHEKRLTIDYLAEVIKHGQPRTAVLTPSMLEELCESEMGMECLKTLDMLVFGGAPMAREAGDRIAEVVHLHGARREGPHSTRRVPYLPEKTEISHWGPLYSSPGQERPLAVCWAA